MRLRKSPLNLRIYGWDHPSLKGLVMYDGHSPKKNFQGIQDRPLYMHDGPRLCDENNPIYHTREAREARAAALTFEEQRGLHAPTRTIEEIRNSQAKMKNNPYAARGAYFGEGRSFEEISQYWAERNSKESPDREPRKK